MKRNSYISLESVENIYCVLECGVDDILEVETLKELENITYHYDLEPTLSIAAEKPAHYGKKSGNKGQTKEENHAFCDSESE